MLRLSQTALAAVLLATAAGAQTLPPATTPVPPAVGGVTAQIMTTVPANAMTVINDTTFTIRYG